MEEKIDLRRSTDLCQKLHSLATQIYALRFEQGMAIYHQFLVLQWVTMFCHTMNEKSN